jgi:hypothetical protein
MPTYFIEEIDFRNPLTPGTDDLQYPLYPKLIDYTIVTEKVRESLQIEPAFQFLDPKDEEYEFVLTMPHSSSWRFAKAGSQPAFRETTSRNLSLPPEPKVFLATDRRTCSVKLKPKSWGSEPELIVLRIFCNHSSEAEGNYGLLNGVSLTFVNPGGKPMSGARGTPRAPVFNLDVTGFQKIGSYDAPIYKIFQSATPPAGTSIEPVFRVSPARPNADVRVLLQHPRLTFPNPLAVFTRDTIGTRPPELSKLEPANPKQLDFSWSGGALPTPKKFGFHVPVVINPLSNGERTWVAQPPRARTYIDPILFHDPPMG